jgi:hypothetical protein
MRKDKSGQSSLHRTKIKNLIELYDSYQIVVQPETKNKDVLAALEFFSFPYTTQRNEES